MYAFERYKLLINKQHAPAKVTSQTMASQWSKWEAAPGAPDEADTSCCMYRCYMTNT